MNCLIGEFYAYMQRKLAIGCTFNDGLCLELMNWALAEKVLPYPQGNILLATIKAQFKEAGLNTQYPFNIDGDEYCHEQRGGKLYSNPQRIKWIIDHASNY